MRQKSLRKKNMPGSGAADAPAVNEFCGKCHRPHAATGVAIRLELAWKRNATSPSTLTRALLSQEPAATLRCLTCTNCTSSGPQAGRTPTTMAAAGVATRAFHSPRSPSICLERAARQLIDCHMPLVSPQAPMRFPIMDWNLPRGAKLKQHAMKSIQQDSSAGSEFDQLSSRRLVIHFVPVWRYQPAAAICFQKEHDLSGPG